jgi:lambda repressor-like predicted transcriptional regulator
MNDLIALERHKKVYQLRQNGLTLKEIASQMGVSKERIRQMLAKYERQHRDTSCLAFAPARVWIGLKNAGQTCETVKTAQDARNLLGTYNFGRMTLNWFLDHLNEVHGRDLRQWYKEPR